LGPIPNPQSPIPNPQSPIKILLLFINQYNYLFKNLLKLNIIIINNYIFNFMLVNNILN